jgi:hypothetical protein
MPLIDGQYQLKGVVFGEQTYYVTAPPDWGPADLIVNDVPRPGTDGTRIGRETRQGRVLTFEIGVLGDGAGTPNLPEMYDRYAALEAAWQNDDRRDFPSLCEPLTYARGGQIRRVYGRPRRFAPIFPDTGAHWVDVTCDYQTIDPYSYDETPRYTTVGQVATPKAGVRFPIRFPLTFTARDDQRNPNPIVVGGTGPAWPRVFFFGPSTKPRVEFVGAYRVELNVTLRYDEWAVVDPTPWGQIVRKNDASNLAGYLSWETMPLSKQKLQPGRWRIEYSATDPTGSSYAYIDWRNAYHGL